MNKYEYRGVQVEADKTWGGAVCDARTCFTRPRDEGLTRFDSHDNRHFCSKHLAQVMAYAAPKPTLVVVPNAFADAERQRRFASHTIDADQAYRADDIRHACLVLSEKIAKQVPNGREQATALTNLEQVMFHSVAGICREVRK